MKYFILSYLFIVSNNMYSQEVYGNYTIFNNIENALWYEQIEVQITANIIFNRNNFDYFNNPSCKSTLKNPEKFYEIANYWLDSTKVKYKRNFYFINDTSHTYANNDSIFMECSYFSFDLKTKKKKILFQVVYLFDKKGTDNKPLLASLIFRKREQIIQRPNKFKSIILKEDNSEIKTVEEVIEVKY